MFEFTQRMIVGKMCSRSALLTEIVCLCLLCLYERAKASEWDRSATDRPTKWKFPTNKMAFGDVLLRTMTTECHFDFFVCSCCCCSYISRLVAPEAIAAPQSTHTHSPHPLFRLLIGWIGWNQLCGAYGHSKFMTAENLNEWTSHFPSHRQFDVRNKHKKKFNSIKLLLLFE